MRKCRRCGDDLLVRPGPGRIASFCSGRCRVAYHRATRVPIELRERARWVRHVAKRPVTISGRPASVADPATWATYTAARASDVGDGLGFVLGDGIGGIDLDHVIDDHGDLHPDAAALLELLPATYTEISPSGHGLHLYYRMDPGPGTVTRWRSITIEHYPTGRYLTVTRNRWPGTRPRLADFGTVTSTSRGVLAEA